MTGGAILVQIIMIILSSAMMIGNQSRKRNGKKSFKRLSIAMLQTVHAIGTGFCEAAYVHGQQKSLITCKSCSMSWP